MDNKSQANNADVGVQPLPPGFKGKSPTKQEVEFLNEYGLEPFSKCVGCDEYFVSILRDRRGVMSFKAFLNDYHAKFPFDEGKWSTKKDGYVCGACAEGEHGDYGQTVVIFKPSEAKIEKWIVGEYTDFYFGDVEDVTVDDLESIPDLGDYNEEDECPIQFMYHSTDGWRGYHVPGAEGWSELHSDAALWGSGDQEELKKFDVDVKRVLWEAGAEFAVCLSRTSNVFSMGYDVLVKSSEDQLKTLQVVIEVMGLKAKYRDRSRFLRTCLTGDSEETLQGRRMVKAYDMITDNPDANPMEIAKAVVEEVPA